MRSSQLGQRPSSRMIQGRKGRAVSAAVTIWGRRIEFSSGAEAQQGLNVRTVETVRKYNWWSGLTRA
eukprot:1630818-Pyramimonas_sp.AAC.1